MLAQYLFWGFNIKDSVSAHTNTRQNLKKGHTKVQKGIEISAAVLLSDGEV